MTLEKARELLAVQADMGGGYNRNGARLILAEVQRDHGQGAVDGLQASGDGRMLCASQISTMAQLLAVQLCRVHLARTIDQVMRFVQQYGSESLREGIIEWAV